MRVLVCGGRDYQRFNHVCNTLDELHGEAGKIQTVIHGGAKGADDLADTWARQNHVERLIYEADWATHGNAAGPIRNQEMIDEGKPDIVVAFPGGRGTADMVRRAKAAGIEVREIP